MNAFIKREIDKAVQRAVEQKKAWQPIFADVIARNGDKHGHIVSDGYLNETWCFYPRSDIRFKGRGYPYSERQNGRRAVRDKALEDVIPKWATPHDIRNIETYGEMRERESDDLFKRR